MAYMRRRPQGNRERNARTEGRKSGAAKASAGAGKKKRAGHWPAEGVKFFSDFICGDYAEFSLED